MAQIRMAEWHASAANANPRSPLSGRASMEERPTILLAAHLLASRTAHKGSYGMLATRRTPLRQVIDQLYEESLTPASQLRLHVLYDTAHDAPASLAYSN
eukprot:1311026-Prymnesium_polylepis.2